MKKTIFEGAWIARYDGAAKWTLSKTSSVAGYIQADDGTVILNDTFCHDLKDLKNLCSIVKEAVKEFNSIKAQTPFVLYEKITGYKKQRRRL